MVLQVTLRDAGDNFIPNTSYDIMMAVCGWESASSSQSTSARARTTTTGMLRRGGVLEREAAARLVSVLDRHEFGDLPRPRTVRAVQRHRQ